jgi:uncharacterized protein DUF4185
MRPSDLLDVAVLVGTLGATACATPLPDTQTESDAAVAEDVAPPLPVLRGCRPFQGLADRVSGAIRSVGTPRGTLFIADDAFVAGSDVPAVQIETSTSATVDDCLASASLVDGAPTSALPGALAPLAAIETEATVSLFFSQPSTGYGITTPGATSRSFLWTSDRPAYGTAAASYEGYVYVYGCLAARYLDGDCYLARAGGPSIASEAAYSYYVGGGHWSPLVDDAWPMTSGATAVDVVLAPTTGRWLMAYVPPLGGTLTLRIGLSPEGPWSAPIPVARCDLATDDMFCTGVHFHPTVNVAEDSVALSYAIASLSPDAATREAEDPAAWWPRLVALRLPSLP